MQQSMRKEKLRKGGLCFITGCFIKPFNMIINGIFISQAHSEGNFEHNEHSTNKFSLLAKCAYMTLN